MYLKKLISEYIAKFIYHNEKHKWQNYTPHCHLIPNIN